MSTHKPTPDEYYLRKAGLTAPEPHRYSELQRVLNEALGQAAKGKGAQRHATSGQRFEDQPIMRIQELVGSGFALGQAIKKIQESQRMHAQAAMQEILGAINYLAAAYLHREEEAVPGAPEPGAVVYSGPVDEALRQTIHDTFTKGRGHLTAGPEGAQHVPHDEVYPPVGPEENEDIVGHGDNG